MSLSTFPNYIFVGDKLDISLEKRANANQTRSDKMKIVSRAPGNKLKTLGGV